MSESLALLALSFCEYSMPVAGGACCMWYMLDETNATPDSDEEKQRDDSTSGKCDRDDSLKGVGDEYWRRNKCPLCDDEIHRIELTSSSTMFS